MVRMKRKRKRKLILLAAACILCAAALVVLLVRFAFVLKDHLDSKGENILTLAESEPPAEEGGGPGEEPPAEAEVPEEAEEEEPEEEPLSVNRTGPFIDDDSSQDENSVVETEMESGEVKRAYLTFDDGPSVYTDEIIDILSKYGVNATFFVCGTGDTDESLRHVYKRIVENGNAIGMHSYSHVYSKVYGDLDLFQYDLDKIRNLIYNETGVVPRYYRFPGGSGNTIASLPISDYISVLYSQGMEYYDWNVYGGDSSGRSLSPHEIAKNTLDGVDRRKTAVILLHDTGSRRSTVEALPEILTGLKDRGIDLRTIDDETPPLHQSGDGHDE